MFHVKPYETSEAGTNIFVPISESIKVGHTVSKHNQGYQAKTYLYVFIWYPQSVGLWQSHRPNMRRKSQHNPKVI